MHSQGIIWRVVRGQGTKMRRAWTWSSLVSHGLEDYMKLYEKQQPLFITATIFKNPEMKALYSKQTNKNRLNQKIKKMSVKIRQNPTHSLNDKVSKKTYSRSNEIKQHLKNTKTMSVQSKNRGEYKKLLNTKKWSNNNKNNHLSQYDNGSINNNIQIQFVVFNLSSKLTILEEYFATFFCYSFFYICAISSRAFFVYYLQYLAPISHTAMADYSEFRADFVMHFYRKFHKENKKLTLLKIQDKIRQKWNSYDLAKLRDFFIIYCLNKNLNHIDEHDMKFEDWFSRNMCLKFDEHEEKECVQFCKKCQKEFKNRKNPRQLTFKIEYQENKSEDEKPKTPIKQKEEKMQLYETAESNRRRDDIEMRQELLNSPIGFHDIVDSLELSKCPRIHPEKYPRIMARNRFEQIFKNTQKTKKIRKRQPKVY